MLFDPPVTKKELHTLKSLCERCRRNPINVYTNAGKKERELLIQEIQQECDVKYNTGKNRYTLIPRMTKEDINNYKKRQAGKLVFIEEEQQEVDIADNNVYAKIDFDNLIIYYAYYGDFNTKNQLINAILHNIKFYNIYNKNDETLKELLKNYRLTTIKRAERFIDDLLYRNVSDSLTRLNKDHKIDMEEYYLVNNKKISVYEMEPVIQETCRRAGHSNEYMSYKSLGNEYYTIRNQVLQEFIENNLYGFGELLKDGENIEDFIIDYKHIAFYGIDKFATNLTKEQQQILLNNFIGRFRERLRYRIKIGEKRTRKLPNRVIDKNYAQEYFNIFEHDLILNRNVNGDIIYYTPNEFKESGLIWCYDTSRVGTIKTVRTALL